jgi:hypothetical protein
MFLPFTDDILPTSPFDDECRQLADRHYSRRSVGSPQFAGNGRKLVLRDAAGTMLFVWMFHDVQWRMDAQSGYYCQIFRNESARRSSDIILEAEALAVKKWGPNRAFTYVDATKIASLNPGYCFKCAGWHFVRIAVSGKHLLEKELNV